MKDKPMGSKEKVNMDLKYADGTTWSGTFTVDMTTMKRRMAILAILSRHIRPFKLINFEKLIDDLDTLFYEK